MSTATKSGKFNVSGSIAHGPIVEPAPKQPVVQPSVQHIAAHFTAAELHCLRGVCRDADNENASRYLAAALQRAAVAGGAK